MKKFKIAIFIVIAILCLASLTEASAPPGKIILTDSKGKEYYLWIDDAGNLRLKQGEPASDIDGSKIIKEKSSRVATHFIQRVTLILLVISVFILTLILYSAKKK